MVRSTLFLLQRVMSVPDSQSYLDPSSKRRNSPRKFLRRRSVAKLHARQLEAAVDEVRVVVDEAGNGEPALQIDDRSIVADFGARADCHNPIPLNLYRLGPRPLPIASPDFSVRENHGRQ